MTRQILLRAPSVNRREPLLRMSKSTSSLSSTSAGVLAGGGGGKNVRFAEVAGGTTAECAAVCCCCPCGIANLIVLAVYKVPAGLCRRALRRKRRKKLIKRGLLSPKGGRLSCACEENELHIRPFSVNELVEIKKQPTEMDPDVAELEKEMWKRFYGFWRSPSQREDVLAL